MTCHFIFKKTVFFVLFVKKIRLLRHVPNAVINSPFGATRLYIQKYTLLDFQYQQLKVYNKVPPHGLGVAMTAIFMVPGHGSMSQNGGYFHETTDCPNS
jgi:hypothetical protein